MARTDTTQLTVRPREPGHSRATRRLRREGLVPGVIYGGGDDPVSFAVDARELRLALAHGGAVIDLSIEGGKAAPVVVKDLQRHPVRGETIHIDLLRVRLDVRIATTVPLELLGMEDAPGVKEGGVLEHVTRELNIEALPNDIPDVIEHDVSAMEMNDTLTLAAVAIPENVTLLDDPEETVIATLSPPRLSTESEDEIEEETELVGEEGAEAPAEGAEEGAAPADEGAEE
jgi:large subunit ribosomal protein L25